MDIPMEHYNRKEEMALNPPIIENILGCFGLCGICYICIYTI